MNSPEFKGFPSIPRLKRKCVITEKIDGTNGIIHVSDDGLVTAGSRNRWITPDHDNYGFAQWVMDNTEDLKKLGPGYHYGEWWGSGVQRRYGLTEKRYSLFNTSRWGGSESGKPDCCHVVPVLYAGDFTPSIVDETMYQLLGTGSRAAPGFKDPEGVVVYLPAANSLFKVTLGGDGHKTVK